MKAKETQRDSFLVRIWQEKGQSDWRGWVQHTRTGESAFVRSYDELLVFFEHWTGKPAEPPRRGLK